MRLVRVVNNLNCLSHKYWLVAISLYTLHFVSFYVSVITLRYAHGQLMT